jgi:hypothetical protein
MKAVVFNRAPLHHRVPWHMLHGVNGEHKRRRCTGKINTAPIRVRDEEGGGRGPVFAKAHTDRVHIPLSAIDWAIDANEHELAQEEDHDDDHLLVVKEEEEDPGNVPYFNDALWRL